MKKTVEFFILLAALALVLCNTGCDGGSRSGSMSEAPMAEKSWAADEKQSLPAAPEEINADTATYERKLTKTGSIRFQSSDMGKTRLLLANAVSETQAYISSENASETGGRIENTVTIRVPAGNFDALMQKIESSAMKIDYKNIDVQDVTQEYIDLDTRIRTKKEVEARYQELLKRANTVDEILKIEAQIGDIRAEIESAEGRLRYLSKQVTYSTLTVTYYERNTQFRFVHKMGNALRNGWNNLLWVLVGVANLWAIILFVAVVWIVIAYLVKRRKKKIP